jgi:hypothetical protein
MKQISPLSWQQVASPIGEVPGWRVKWFEQRYNADPLLVGVYRYRGTDGEHVFVGQISRTVLMSLPHPHAFIADRCAKSRSVALYGYH